MKKFTLISILIFSFILTATFWGKVEAIEEVKQSNQHDSSTIIHLENNPSAQPSLNFTELVKKYSLSVSKDAELKFERGIVKDADFYANYRDRFDIRLQDGEGTTSRYVSDNLDLGVRGRFRNEKTSYNFMINPLRRLDNYDYFPAMFSDFWIKHNITEHDSFTVGQKRTAIGVEGAQSPFAIPLVMRSQISRTYGNVRTYGATLSGKRPYIDYDLGYYDSGRYLQNLFEGSEFVGWVNFKPIKEENREKYGNLVIGTGLHSGAREYSYNVLGAFASYEKDKFKLAAEYANADGYNGVSISQNKSEGFYTTFSYKFTPKFELVLRYDLFDPNKHISGNDVREYTIGANFYVYEQRLKFALNYVLVDNEAVKNYSKILFVTQFML